MADVGEKSVQINVQLENWYILFRFHFTSNYFEGFTNRTRFSGLRVSI